MSDPWHVFGARTCCLLRGAVPLLEAPYADLVTVFSCFWAEAIQPGRPLGPSKTLVVRSRSHCTLDAPVTDDASVDYPLAVPRVKPGWVLPCLLTVEPRPPLLLPPSWCVWWAAWTRRRPCLRGMSGKVLGRGLDLSGGKRLDAPK
jgi:hypothetical protein